MVHPIQKEFGGGAVYVAEWSDGGRLNEIGVEDMTFKSTCVRAPRGVASRRVA